MGAIDLKVIKMAGNKNSGRGRPTRYEQIQNGNLLDICTTWLVNNFNTFDKDMKLKVALEIAKKGIVQKVEANMTFTAKTIMDAVQEASKQGNRIATHV